MTIAGFLLTVLIVGAAFAAWYYFVHRNGVFNPADADRDDRPRNARPQARFLTETGEIGEREQGKAQDGYTPSSYEYMTENRSMSDFDQKSQVPLPRAGLDQDPVRSAASSAKVLSQTTNAGMNNQPVKQAEQSAQVFQQQQGQGQQGQGQQGQNQTFASAAQQYSTEVGSIGGQQQGQQGQQGQAQSFEGQQAKTARQSAQAFESEIGSIGEASSPQFNEDPSHLAARMELLNKSSENKQDNNQ